MNLNEFCLLKFLQSPDELEIVANILVSMLDEIKLENEQV